MITPLTREEICAERNRLELTLSQAEGLVLALQTLLFDFAGDRLDTAVGKKRQAIIAIGDALEALIVQDWPESDKT
ncbi:hypothetical protein [Gemmobacter sp. LW-1]|uniref:hypothetical protein n=1 Tax=Gemmobacter sp. LW-1 TaxID=1529005 RepID=UPI0006C7493E|nr:hypothetical protein [Gemmobacter sp. LW-1]